MTRYITITGIDDKEATARERADVTIGKTYKVYDKAGGFDVDPFFIDDANEQNFGCDEENSVYFFTTHSEEPAAC